MHVHGCDDTPFLAVKAFDRVVPADSLLRGESVLEMRRKVRWEFFKGWSERKVVVAVIKPVIYYLY